MFVFLYDGASATTTPISSTDAGTLAESAALAATLAGTDSGAASESTALAATLPGTDAGTLADSTATLAVTLSAADAAALGESIVLAAAIATTDSGSLAESASVTSFAGATSSDAGTLAESASSLAAATAASDGATLGESATVAVAIAGTDAGHLTESASIGGNQPAADLVEAVADWLDADASLVAQFGRTGFLSAGAAGRATPMPHAVWVDVSGAILGDAAPAGDGSDLAWVDRHEHQITVYAGARRLARSLARGIVRSLERAAEAGSIRFDEGSLLYLRRDGDGLDQLDPDRGRDGKDVWSHTIQFLAMIESSDA